MALWKDLFNALDKEFSVYPPATKKDKCTEPYIVLKNDGENELSGTTSTQQYWSVMIYMPYEMYSFLEEYVDKVVDYINANLYPQFRPTGYKSSPFYDDTVKAYMVSVQYISYKKNKNIDIKL